MATAELIPLPGWRGQAPLDAGAAIERLRARHPAVAGAWADAYPALDRALAAQDPWLGYSCWGAEAARISAGADDAWLCGFLLWNIERFDAIFAALGLAAEFRLHFTDSFHRIIDQIEADPGFARTRRDVFLKDLGLTRGRLIPAAARLLYPYAGVSWRVLARNPAALPFVLGRCGGRRPYFGLHVHQPMAAAYFNAAGWAQTQRLAALALEAFPHVRGVMGASWFYDPAVPAVSPHLSHILERPLRHGARLLRLGEHPDYTRDALATSETRRGAEAEGHYRPRGYALLWARQDVIAAAG